MPPNRGRTEQGRRKPGNDMAPRDLNPFQSRRRRAFTKLLKDESATMRNVSEAVRFLDGMDTFESKADLLGKLEDKRDNGPRRIREVLSFVNSVRDVQDLFIPLLDNLITDETARPMFVSLRNRVLTGIYFMPVFLDTLVQYNVAKELHQDSARTFCSFLVAVSEALIEARNSDSVKDLAKDLRERSDVDEARILCAVLLVDRNESKSGNPKLTQEPRCKSAVLWVTDEIPPGGRHDNDHRNYRDIQVLPTADELSCQAQSWLPLASGENNLIQDPAIRVLDKNFRLLREDAIRTMKTNIAEQGRFLWKNARLFDIDTTGSKKNGSFSFLVQMDSRTGGDPNWDRSRALIHGSVVALCREGAPRLMGIISVREHTEKNKWLNHPGGPVIGVTFDSDVDFKHALKDVQGNCAHNAKLESLFRKKDEIAKQRPHSPEVKRLNSQIVMCCNQFDCYDLVEASSSFFTYRPILKSLQAMSDLPFLSLLRYDRAGEDPCVPDYLPRILSMPQDKCFAGYQCDLDSWSSEELVSKTSLDFSQAEAIRHAFTNSVALLQGPPGTGKTFIGALIARMIRENTDASILCVCYTNHALDQFLEHMLDAGETRIVRIGGRSKSERLSKYQLRELARSKASDRIGKFRRIKQVDAQLHRTREMITEGIERIKRTIGWRSPYGGMGQFLLEDYPDIYRCLVLNIIDDGFQVMGPDSKPLRDDFLWKTWSQGEEFPIWLRAYTLEALSDQFDGFWSMPQDERLEMMRGWQLELVGSEIDSLNRSVNDFNALRQERMVIQQEQDLDILHNARIVGATTTGAAQVKELLSLKEPGVVIVEEAGEVLEAHVLSTLQASSTKHLVLIGDHQQLRPKVESYQLATVSKGGYNLDCSLFERLVLSNLPSVKLDVQHRMRPEISDFIRKQTYPSLKDHPSVESFPDVKGVCSNVVFIDHDFQEDGESTSNDDIVSMKTKANSPEAGLCVEIVRYLLLQGYLPESIVILTPYLGQLKKILRLVQTQLKEATAVVSDNDRIELEDMIGTDNIDQAQGIGKKSVRCSSIDNFQGEESDIVVASLVRSNKKGIIGFMKEEQRVNVLMSRAREGMFLVGNAATVRRSRQGQHLWNPILDDLRDSGRLLKGLPTYCQLHAADQPKVLSSVEDFRKVRPNGGCTRRCNFRMDCGHTCRLTCHPYDRSHSSVSSLCNQPCKRVPPECHRGHICPKMCKDECGACTVRVGPVVLDCSHSMESALCHETRNQQAINKLSKRCKHVVPQHLFECGHKFDTSCSNAKSHKPICPGKCGHVIEACGHPCEKSCGRCDGEHSCGTTCGRKTFCGHICNQPCHQGKDCPPCKRPCEVTCCHSSCAKRCNVPCASCVEPCDWSCKHQGQCQLVCGAPCSRLPCNKRCEKNLECGHQCPSVCGEQCPDQKFCQECGSAEKQERIVDMIMLNSYKNHCVDNDPILVLPCQHFYSMSTLDGHLSMTEVYEESSPGSGDFVALKSLAEANLNEKPLSCPDCRSVIHSVCRYGRLLRLSELRSLERKSLMGIDQTLKVLSHRVDSQQDAADKKKQEDLVKKLEKLEVRLLVSPMRKVYNACHDRSQFEVPKPPTRPLLHTLELLGCVLSQLAETREDEHYQKAVDVLKRAISHADETKSTRSGGSLRLSLGALMMKWPSPSDAILDEARDLVHWINQHEAQMSPESMRTVQELDERINDPNKEIREVLKAMHVLDGYNYGGSWSSHWYECPNGHPYFIGNCGGAMEVSRCMECGLGIGGQDHQLDSSNRNAGGIVAEVLQEEHT